MADNPNDFEDEYQFTDIDDPVSNLEGSSDTVKSTTSTASSSASTIMRNLSGNDLKRNIGMGFGILLGIFLFYKFMGTMFSGSKSTTKSTQTTISSSNTMTKPVVSKPVIQATTSTATTPVFTQSKGAPDVLQKLNSLEISATNNRNSLNSVKNSVDNLQTNIESLNLKLSDLNKNIANLTLQLETQQQQLVAMLKKPKKRVRKAKRVIRPQISYAIQAIIPGRAWLMSSNGTTITVSEGSSVPGFGRVKLIDPHQGKVMMSSGKTIRFSSSDT